MKGPQSDRIVGLPTRRRAGTKSGKVALRALLLTDLVGSTELIESLGDVRSYEVFARHDRLARDLVEKFDGIEIDKTDGFLFLFERPVDAVGCAMAYHHELMMLSQEFGVELVARAGIHFGEVHLRRNSDLDVARGAKPVEVEGLAKPLAARVMALARGGQTLMTQGAFELARRAVEAEEPLAQGLTWLSHGTYQLKGVEAPTPIFEVGQEGLAPLLAPPEMRIARGNRYRRNSVVVLGLLLIVVLLGIVAFLQFDRRGARPSVAILSFKNLSGQSGGAWLATALSELVATELAAGGEIRIISGESVARMRQELSLGEAETLSSDTLTKVRRNLGTDFVLIGSYLSLDQGEQLQLTLSLQSTRDGATVATLPERGREAELFDLVSGVGRQLRRYLDVADLTESESEAVRATLSSNPEATRFYSEGLDKLRSYDALAARDVLLSAVEVDPEYAVAHAALSKAWAELGYDREATDSARRAFELTMGLPREEILSIKGRYYETVADWDQAVDTYQLLWDFFSDNIEYGLRLVEAQISAGRPSDARVTLGALRELPEPIRDDPRIDLAEASLANSVSDFQRQLEATKQAVMKGQATGAWILVAEARRQQGWAWRQLGRRNAAMTALEEALRLFADAGDRGKVAQVLNPIAILRKWGGDFDGAEEIYRRALAIHRETGNRRWVAEILDNLALVIQEQGDLASAETMSSESLAVARDLGDREKEAEFLGNLAWILFESGDLAQAEKLNRQALEIFETIGHRVGAGWRYLDLGFVCFEQGKLAEAVELANKARAIAEETGHKHLLGYVLDYLGQIQVVMGDLPRAEQLLEESWVIRSETGEKSSLAATRLSRARLALAQGRLEEAVDLAGRASMEFASGGRRDRETAAAAVLVSALLSQGSVDQAREALSRVREAAQASQNPRVRLAVELSAARMLDADGQPGAARSRLAEVVRESSSLGFRGLELDGRLAIAELGGETAAAAQRTWDELVKMADEFGYGLIATRAAVGSSAMKAAA